MCSLFLIGAVTRARSRLTHTLAAEAGEQGITINSLKWPGSIYKHGEMLFTMSDWMDYTSARASEGNTPDTHTVYTEVGDWGRQWGGPEWHVLQSGINIQ